MLTVYLDWYRAYPMAYPCFPSKDSPGAELIVGVLEWDKSNATLPPEVSLVEILHMPFSQLKLGRVFKLG